MKLTHSITHSNKTPVWVWGITLLGFLLEYKMYQPEIGHERVQTEEPEMKSIISLLLTKWGFPIEQVYKM